MTKKLLVFICVLLLVGCNSKPSATPEVARVVELPVVTQAVESIPSATESASTDPNAAYPITFSAISTDQTYPIESAFVLPPGEKMGPDFQLDMPIKVGDMSVTGTGPAGVPILLIDMNDPGKIWGETIISEDGDFEFLLTEGLPSNHQIAITLGDLAGTDFNPADFIYNPNYIDRYMLGVLFDTALIGN